MNNCNIKLLYSFFKSYKSIPPKKPQHFQVFLTVSINRNCMQFNLQKLSALVRPKYAGEICKLMQLCYLLPRRPVELLCNMQMR